VGGKDQVIGVVMGRKGRRDGKVALQKKRTALKPVGWGCRWIFEGKRTEELHTYEQYTNSWGGGGTKSPRGEEKTLESQ